MLTGVILAIMILPTMAAISREVLLAIPGSCGAAQCLWEPLAGNHLWCVTASRCFRHSRRSNLGIRTCLGETMAVTMVIGNSPAISASLLALGYTIPAVLANEFGALDDLHIGALMYLALILFAVTLLVNIVAVLMVQLIGRRQGNY